MNAARSAMPIFANPDRLIALLREWLAYTQWSYMSGGYWDHDRRVALYMFAAAGQGLIMVAAGLPRLINSMNAMSAAK
ncbi:MAG: hypothetical protein P8Y48_02015 [Novosphingobium sp.]